MTQSQNARFEAQYLALKVGPFGETARPAARTRCYGTQTIYAPGRLIGVTRPLPVWKDGRLTLSGESVPNEIRLATFQRVEAARRVAIEPGVEGRLSDGDPGESGHHQTVALHQHLQCEL